ncbi:nitroreductase family protein [Megasphaera vaginalis (ex Srinivasan et al. 2021)]|uniref:Nitroreductase family protein n=1 Tax=Megasphaera vaginalis (ex Srinivasan et al. 2021) TaxID=1111454 RepID=U7UMH0_9FIRM|nr:nitroreductase family protein [Megasphaera vaginalis (ex Srinivasan et al. 2021)]ERT60535.1 nitroreductase family protein [Megasphaera vaginalis (ex Srinivasan et al. 2021)]
MSTLIDAFAKRRTNYALDKNVTIAQSAIIKTVQDVIHEVPSAFNMQSGKVIVAFGKKHDKIWQIAMDTLRAIVPAENFGTTEVKINSFAAAYGTILYFDNTAVVKSMQEQFPLYADNFPVWAQQANGMMQFGVWSALTDLGLGVNMQHYNPLIDDAVKNEFQVPAEWQLIAQMPFGNPTAVPDPIAKDPIDERVLVFDK